MATRHDQITCSILMIIISSSLFFLPFSESIYFKIDNFTNKSNVNYLGDAEPINGTIVFNDVNYFTRVGQAKYAEPIHIWDKKSGKISDFTTHFGFIVDTLNQSVFGDGITFFLAPADFQIPPNSAAGFLGLFNKTYTDSPINQIIVIEFDTYPDKEWDPPYGHVGINKNSLNSTNYTSWNASVHSGDLIDAWVSYNSTAKILNLIWGYGDKNISLSCVADLRDVLPEWVTIGFSAATGTYVERHTLLYWEFDSNLYILEKSSDDSKKWKMAVGLSVPLSVIFVIIIVACTGLCRSERIRITAELETVSLTLMMNDDDLEIGAAKRFAYSDLILATNNFSNDRKLGEGGFGCVYKGYLHCEDIHIAVKKISQGSKQGKKEYMTEVKINSSLRHRNLVQLIGWCHDDTQFLLVYEFMPNGSLDTHLFGKKIGLEWGVRYKIALGLASALLYLHEEWEQCVVHRDIKPSNIMLDSGFNVKLGDFGLARFMQHELGHQTTGLAGTLGYMAPEYLTTGQASKESDVYSFGVVALEIACGRRVVDDMEWNFKLGLVKRVWDLFGKGELLSCVDPLLGDEFDVDQVECLLMIGLWCAHPDKNMRPSIRQAIQVLKSESALPNLPMNMPVPIYYSDPDVVHQLVGSLGATMTDTSIDLAR